ncbi:MAG: hypothetical protein WCW66_04645 [Patescibacteria group bacterium]|jgi:hypothetical protein
MPRRKNPNAELLRDRQAQRRRKNFRRKWANSPTFVAKHPTPWHWDHGVLYDKYGAEIIRESPNACGKDANPAPQPHEHRVTPPSPGDRFNNKRSFPSSPIYRPWGI